jgi:hypothetical protein
VADCGRFFAQSREAFGRSANIMRTLPVGPRQHHQTFLASFFKKEAFLSFFY